MNLSGLAGLPRELTPTQKRNFVRVQIDGIAIGLASAASPFLPVFLARLGATNLEVGLLTAMPGVTGLLLAIIVGRFVQTRRQVVPWYSAGRLMVVSCYALTGLVPFLVPHDYQVVAILLIWALATLPQTLTNVCFSVVMSAVAGPKHRYDLMSRRWSALGLTTAVTVALVGQVLSRIGFPINYQIVFLSLSLGGLVSYYFSSHIELPDAEPPTQLVGQSPLQQIKAYAALVRGERAFVSFMAKRFVHMSGMALATPLFPLYYVRAVQASDAWIGLINTVHTGIVLVGYYFWTRQSKSRGSRFVLLWTTFGMSLYPIGIAFTLQVEWIALYAGLAGIVQAGLDLVLFDELMKTFPAKYSATFVYIAQSLQYLSTVAAQLVGTALADQIGLSGALVVSGVLRLIGFGMFALGKNR